jgi:hypothetical protein
MLEQDKRRFVEPAGEVSGERIHGDDEVESVDGAGEREDAVRKRGFVTDREVRGFLGAWLLCEIPELEVRIVENRFKELQRNGARWIPVARGPDNSDAGFGVWAKLERWSGNKVAGGDWKVGEGGAEDVGELHDFELDVVFGRLLRSMFAPCDDVVDSREIWGKRQQAGWNFKGDFGRNRAELRGVSKHLNGVAETVKATDDEALAGDGFAGPEAVRVGRVAGAESVALLPGLFEVSGEHVELPQVAVDAVWVGARRRRERKCLACRGEIAAVEQAFGFSEELRGSIAHRLSG